MFVVKNTSQVIFVTSPLLPTCFLESERPPQSGFLITKVNFRPRIKYINLTPSHVKNSQPDLVILRPSNCVSVTAISEFNFNSVLGTELDTQTQDTQDTKMPNPNDKRDDTLLGQAAKAGVATGLAKSIGGDGAAKLVSGAMVAGDLLHGNVVCIPCKAFAMWRLTGLGRCRGYACCSFCSRQDCKG
jgi:hypothetical protein